jgi:hypothetical protein
MNPADAIPATAVTLVPAAKSSSIYSGFCESELQNQGILAQIGATQTQLLA